MDIPLIYILSNGRSGSTLLDLLLGTHPAIWTMGEVQMLPLERRLNRHPCGCGAPIAECPFWQGVLRRVALDGRVYPLEHFRPRYSGGKVLRWEHLSDLVHGGVGDRWRAAARAYGDTNAEYLHAVREMATECSGQPIEFLVDASKDPYRLLWLHASRHFSIRVIHLIRDPRAFVYSVVKHDLPHARTKAAIAAARWVIENLLFARLVRAAFAPEHIVVLRYEDLACAPQATVRALGDWLHCDFRDDAVNRFRVVANHAVSGGRMRWEKSGVEFDERWRRALPAHYARLVWSLTWAVAWKYGYR